MGGAIFGFLGVALPLTLFTGSEQLKSVLQDAGTLGLGLLVAILFAKILAFAVSMGSGFVGGPIFPALFIGGTAGVAVHEVFSSVPLGLTFTCMFAAVAGALVAAPFAMALTGAFMTQVGALQTAPILIAVVTSFLAMEGVKYFVASRDKKAQPSRATGPGSDAVLDVAPVSDGERPAKSSWWRRGPSERAHKLRGSGCTVDRAAPRAAVSSRPRGE